MHRVGGRQTSPVPVSSPQQSGLPGGQQRKRPVAALVATVPAGQQPLLPIARALGQQTRVMASADETRAALVDPTHTSFALQQSRLPQQWSPQHCSFEELQHSVFPQQVSSFLLQHPAPQQALSFGQQWSPQHRSLSVQHSRPHVVVPRGQRHLPDWHRFSGGQQRPAQQLSPAPQQLERLSLEQHFGVVPPQHLPGVEGDGPLPTAPSTTHPSSPVLQHRERGGLAQNSPSLQHFSPQRVGQSGTHWSPGSPLPHFVPGGQQIFSHGGPPDPVARGQVQQTSSGVQQSR
jgi:hypothetical protein